MSRRCIFLDRDGVINVKAATGEYIVHWEQFRLLPNISDWIRLFNALDYLVIVVTNQRCIARGLTTSQEVDGLHRKMIEQLGDAGAYIDDVFVCPHEEGTCGCRKPQPGLIDQARTKWDIDLAQSLMIGDSQSDAELARNCGLRYISVADGKIVESAPAER